MDVSTLVLVMSLLMQGAQSRAERPLPQFQVVTVDGAPLSSQQLTSEPQFLLLYVNASSSTSRKLLDAVGEWATPELLRRTVLVVGGTPQEARQFLDESVPEELQGMVRYLDVNKSAWQALNLRGSPVLVGVRDGKTEWSLSGVLADPAALKSVVMSWVTF